MRTFDAVVVGSGFGGAVAACRLAERGGSVVVLERGRRWERTDFPRPGQPRARWWFQGDERGLFELRRFAGMKVIVAAGVGGGSLVYTNVQKIPLAAAFQGWPEPVSLDSLHPYYARVEEMLDPSPIPHPLVRLQAFEAAHATLGRAEGLERPPLAIRWGEGDLERANRFGALQKPCNLCGQCIFGCDRHAKNTLDLTYLKRAETLGAEVWPLCQVNRIEPRALGYEVRFRRLPDREAGKPEEETVAARRLYLAAGSLGTTELLLRARDVDATLPKLSRRLGEGWSPNGDFFAGLIGSRIPIQPTVGPSVAAGYESAPEGFYVLEGAIPPAAAEPHKTLLRLVNHLFSLRRFFSGRSDSSSPGDTPACADPESEELLRHMGVFFLMGRESSHPSTPFGTGGRLRLGPRGELELDWDARESELLFGRIRRYLAELGRGYGGWMVVPERWWAPDLGSVHPLGGCGMGRDASAGVVDAFGRVFGYENLFVCDGSIVPRALGVPPSMTIAALAEHVVENSVSG